MLWVRSKTTYYMEVYRPAEIADTNDEALLRSRLFHVHFDHCDLGLEWNTYDNQNITAGPYKLFVVATPKSTLLKSVTLVSLDITSNKGVDYDLNQHENPIWRIDVSENKKKYSKTLESSLDFDFDSQEQITTRMVFRFMVGSTVSTEAVDIDWKPVRVRYWSSIL